jgi:hypothetical protein
VNFYEFLTHIDEFKQKKFIGTMIKYYNTTKNKNNTKNEYIVFKEIYNICITAINIFRPLVAMEIYSKYKPQCVLDFCAGWGGRLIGACALNVPEYIGIDINVGLEQHYNKISSFFDDEERKKRLKVKTQFKMFYESAVTFDYSKIEYDMVLTSPPYYFLEKYSNNVILFLFFSRPRCLYWSYKYRRPTRLQPYISTVVGLAKGFIFRGFLCK